MLAYYNVRYVVHARVNGAVQCFRFYRFAPAFRTLRRMREHDPHAFMSRPAAERRRRAVFDIIQR